MLIKDRFRGYCPIVIDVESAGLDPRTHALLECAAISLVFNEEGKLCPSEIEHWHIQPHPDTLQDPAALKFTGIDPTHPFRYAIDEKTFLEELFNKTRALLKKNHCQRALLVGHNAWFDLQFLQAAILRHSLKNSPYHAFTAIDTASLGAVFLGHTVLATLLERAQIPYNKAEAHSALYDAECTAQLFCYFVNRLEMESQKWIS
jgi:ribonuclease T